MDPLPRALIVIGAALLLLGLFLHFGPPVPLGRLPGDLRIERPGFRLYLPLTTCLLISIVLSLLLWLFTRWR